MDYLNRGTEKYTTKYWVEKDKSAEFPSEFLASISELGLTSVLLPEEFGGPGMSISDYVKLVRQVSGLHGVAGGDLLMAHNTFGIFPLVSIGSREQKEEYLPKLGSNKIIPSIAITEPNAGSDTLNISTRAVKSSGEYILSYLTYTGVKCDVSKVIGRYECTAFGSVIAIDGIILLLPSFGRYSSFCSREPMETSGKIPNVLWAMRRSPPATPCKPDTCLTSFT